MRRVHRRSVFRHRRPDAPHQAPRDSKRVDRARFRLAHLHRNRKRRHTPRRRHGAVDVLPAAPSDSPAPRRLGAPGTPNPDAEITAPASHHPEKVAERGEQGRRAFEEVTASDDPPSSSASNRRNRCTEPCRASVTSPVFGGPIQGPLAHLARQIELTEPTGTRRRRPHWQRCS